MAAALLIDYGSGNLRSAENALRRAAAELDRPPEILVGWRPELVRAADRLVLPGVGAFAACMAALAGRPGLVPALREAVGPLGRPFLGVCVGMQLLADRGLEFGETQGLGLVPGAVRRLEPAVAAAKVPHVGWNDLEVVRETPLIPRGVGPVYFTHSFAFAPDAVADVAALADHGGPFAAAVVRDNLAGVQFHPEKSQGEGISLLARFLSWRP